MKDHRAARAFDLVTLTLLLLGLGLGYVLGPQIVRDAYDQNSLPFFNDALSSHADESVDRQIKSIEELTLYAALLLACMWALGRWALSRGAPWREILLRSEPNLSVGEGLRAAAWVGLAFGFLEAGFRVLYYQVSGVFQDRYSPDVLWMAPLAQTAYFCAITLVLLGLAGGRPRRISMATLMVILSAFGFWGVLVQLKTGAHWLALYLLSVGAVSHLARQMARHPVRWRAAIRRSFVPLAVLPVGLFTVFHPIASWRESATIRALSPAASGAPNIILLVLDTTRRKSMGLYGYARPTTPFLDGLADQAAVYDGAVAPSPWTLPSQGSMFTGRNVNEIQGEFRVPLDRQFPTVAEFLSEHGYATGGFTANMFFTTKESGLARGFHTYRDTPVTAPAVIASAASARAVGGRLQKWASRWLSPRRKFAEDVNQEFLGWVDRLGDRPFFAYLNYFDAHEPYERFDEQDRFEGEPPDTLVAGVESGTRVVLPPARRRDVNRYDGSIAHMDAALAALVASLCERGLMDNTVLIVTADHGDQFGERGLRSHVSSLYGELLFVPLLIHAPGRIHPTRIATPVPVRALAATVASMAGLGAESPFPGPSLLEPDVSEAIFSELVEDPFTESVGPIARGPMQSLVLGNWHYIRSGDAKEELYDLATDPDEIVDRSADPDLAKTLRQLRQALREAGQAGPAAAQDSGAGGSR